MELAFGNWEGEIMDRVNFFKLRAAIEKGYNSSEPLCTKRSLSEQQKINCLADYWFPYYDSDNNSFISEQEFTGKILKNSSFCKNEQEAKNLYQAIRDDDGTISAERYGAFSRVREGGGPFIECGKILMSENVNNWLKEIAQNGPETLSPDGLTLAQKIDLIQYGKIRSITTEQLESGRFQVVKEDEATE